jgi:ribosomal protein S12 methylthiotransferase
MIRGNLQSRKLSGILAEAEALAQQGVKELLIISHDFTDYGWDLRRKDKEAIETPANLLRALCSVEGIQWIRLLYLYPDGVTPELLEVIKTEKKIVKYFDMPLQHISDEMLKRMNRKMTRDEIETVLQNIREQIPEAHIRTQFIVGFPGETEEHFQELIKFVADQKFDRVGCFKYSPEENTAGGKMIDQIDEQIKEERYSAIMTLAQKISRQTNKKMVGKTLRVLVEGISEESELLLQGRYYGQAPDIDGVVLINSGQAVKGEFVNVKITKAFEYDLLGEIVESEIQLEHRP